MLPGGTAQHMHHTGWLGYQMPDAKLSTRYKEISPPLQQHLEQILCQLRSKAAHRVPRGPFSLGWHVPPQPHPCPSSSSIVPTCPFAGGCSSPSEVMRTRNISQCICQGQRAASVPKTLQQSNTENSNKMKMGTWHWKQNIWYSHEVF